MILKDLRNSAGINGNVHPRGKGKVKVKIFRTFSHINLQNLTSVALNIMKITSITIIKL